MTEPASSSTPTLEDVVAAFARGRTVRGALNHREHVMIAWHYARTRPGPEGLAELARGIREVAVGLGKPDLYHETLTWAWFSLVRERVERLGPSATWEAFEAASADILSGRALDALYDRATLDSPLAKRVFLLPDRPRHGAEP